MNLSICAYVLLTLTITLNNCQWVGCSLLAGYTCISQAGLVETSRPDRCVWVSSALALGDSLSRQRLILKADPGVPRPILGCYPTTTHRHHHRHRRRRHLPHLPQPQAMAMLNGQMMRSWKKQGRWEIRSSWFILKGHHVGWSVCRWNIHPSVRPVPSRPVPSPFSIPSLHPSIHPALPPSLHPSIPPSLLPPLPPSLHPSTCTYEYIHHTDTSPGSVTLTHHQRNLWERQHGDAVHGWYHGVSLNNTPGLPLGTYPRCDIRIHWCPNPMPPSMRTLWPDGIDHCQMPPTHFARPRHRLSIPVHPPSTHPIPSHTEGSNVSEGNAIPDFKGSHNHSCGDMELFHMQKSNIDKGYFKSVCPKTAIVFIACLSDTLSGPVKRHSWKSWQKGKLKKTPESVKCVKLNYVFIEACYSLEVRHWRDETDVSVHARLNVFLSSLFYGTSVLVLP